MAGLENERDVNDIDDDEELEQGSEPSAELSDPQAPVEIETDESKVSRRREKRQERKNEFERLRRENEELRTQRQAPQQHYQPPPQQQVHPVAAKLKALDDRESRLFKEYETVASRPGYDRNGQEEANYQRMAKELQVERMITVSQAAAPQINEEEIVRKINWRNFTNEHADVHGADGNTAAWRWALAKWQQNVAEGKADTKAMAEEILDQARLRFGMKPRRGSSSVTAADRQRYSGMSSRAGASSGGEGKVQMGPNEKRMARIAFDGKKVNGKEMTDDQKYQYWANTVGKKLLAQKSGRE